MKLSQITPTIPVTDINKSREFYENVLGLTPSAMEVPPDGMLYDAGDGTHLFIYQRGPSKADHTLASFTVENIGEAVDQLSQKGVAFEHYDMPNLKTDEKGIAVMGNAKSAWFKDPDGNILSIVQVS